VARYVVEVKISDGWQMPAAPEVIERNADEGVTWIHTYVSEEREKAFCVYDAPGPEAIRNSVARIGFPIDRISQVRELSPYVYTTEKGRIG